MNTLTQTTEAVVANAAVKTTYLTAIGTGLYSFVGSNAFAIMCGAIASVGAMIIAWYYKGRDEQRKQRAEARLIRSHELDIQEREARIKRLNLNRDSGFASLTPMYPSPVQEISDEDTNE